MAKEREVSEWKEKYEESRREVMEMRWVISVVLLQAVDSTECHDCTDLWLTEVVGYI